MPDDAPGPCGKGHERSWRYIKGRRKAHCEVCRRVSARKLRRYRRRIAAAVRVIDENTGGGLRPPPPSNG